MPPTEPQPELLLRYLARRSALCPSCGYNLRGLTELVCPECGKPVTFVALDAAAKSRRGFAVTFGCIGLLAFSVLVFPFAVAGTVKVALDSLSAPGRSASRMYPGAVALALGVVALSAGCLTAARGLERWGRWLGSQSPARRTLWALACWSWLLLALLWPLLASLL